jgi:Tfp pilus assembly protein PilZ
MYAGKKMIERRNDDRQTYFGKIFFATRTRLYEGDLLNYSKAGLFIQSHALLAVGNEIIVAPPYSKEKNDKHKGRIVRCTEGGFGVKLLKQIISHKSFERRQEIRQIWSGNILFATKDKLYTGELVNFSTDGLFIKMNEPLPVGKIIKVALPYSQDKNDKRKGIITWSNEEGFGVRLFRTFEYRPLIIWQGSFT